MRFILALLICLCAFTIAGCGGGTSTDNPQETTYAVKGTATGGARSVTVTGILFFERGHAEEADHLIASATVPNGRLDPTPFHIVHLEPGAYDVQVCYEYWLEFSDIFGDLRKIQGDHVFPGIEVKAQPTDVGTLDLQLAPPF